MSGEDLKKYDDGLPLYRRDRLGKSSNSLGGASIDENLSGSGIFMMMKAELAAVTEARTSTDAPMAATTGQVGGAFSSPLRFRHHHHSPSPHHHHHHNKNPVFMATRAVAGADNGGASTAGGGVSATFNGNTYYDNPMNPQKHPWYDHQSKLHPILQHHYNQQYNNRLENRHEDRRVVAKGETRGKVRKHGKGQRMSVEGGGNISGIGDGIHGMYNQNYLSDSLVDGNAIVESEEEKKTSGEIEGERGPSLDEDRGRRESKKTGGGVKEGKRREEAIGAPLVVLRPYYGASHGSNSGSSRSNSGQSLSPPKRTTKRKKRRKRKKQRKKKRKRKERRTREQIKETKDENSVESSGESERKTALSLPSSSSSSSSYSSSSSDDDGTDGTDKESVSVRAHGRGKDNDIKGHQENERETKRTGERTKKGAHSHPVLNPDCEIDHKELTFGKVIGQGAFGRVHEGEFRGTKVAIKVNAERERSRGENVE